jgi:hypothetical protein
MGGFRKRLVGALLVTATLGTGAAAMPAGASTPQGTYDMYDTTHWSPKVQVGYGIERKTSGNRIVVGAVLHKSTEIPAGTYHVNIVYGDIARPFDATVKFACDLRLKGLYASCSRALTLNVDDYPTVAVSITRDGSAGALAIAFVRV